MMKTLMAILVLGSAAWAQEEPPKEPPKRQDPPVRPDRRDPFEGPREGRGPQPPNPPQPPGPGERRPLQPPFNPEEARSWLKDNEPETYRRLMEAQEGGRREESMRILNEAMPRMREMNELKQRDPKGFEKMMDMRRLERESFDQADAARRAPPEEREAASKKLKETLGRLFDAREEVRARELAELKRRVEALEKAITDRKATKERIVERRRRELLGEKSEEDW
ncbi:MAG: hypothetical protein HY293_06430 [Planctomycetes bacterium]|nr:hypothetical protein [Planctomycetota bacterium]